MDARSSDPEPLSNAAESRPLLSTRALLIVLTAVLIGIAVALKPVLAVPIGVSIAVVTLLVKVLGD